MKTFLLLFIITTVFAQAQTAEIKLTGNLQTDSRILFAANRNEILSPVQLQLESGKKNPMLAGLFSLVLPGSGEFYSESYLKAGIFIAVEALVVTTAIIYNKKGNDKTTQFEDYADDQTNGWSVVKYAKWIVDHKDILGLPDDLSYDDIITNNNSSLPSWEQVNFDQLNYYEGLVSSEGYGFTHRLERHGEQQYYELIGKYHQYAPGWTEFNPNDPDPHDVPQQMLFYSGLRGKANDYYNVSETAVVGIYINHFLSALDAVWSAISFNKDLAFNARVERVDLADRTLLIPTIKVKYSF
jgi:hypothetical protein